MGEHKLYFKLPNWLFIICIISSSILSVAILSDIFFLKNTNEFSTYKITVFIFSHIVSIFIIVFAWYFIIAVQFKNKYYYIINKEGIYNNQVNITKKYLQWENELYYCITNSFRGLYTSKMLPIEGKITNDKNIKEGYISIKSKKALRKYYDNKNWIVISTKLIRNNIKIDDIVNMVNKSREKV